MVLLAVAALFLRSLVSSQTVDPGFRADGIVDAEIDLALLGGQADAGTTFARILRETAAMPSATSATLAAVVPLTGSNMESRAIPEGAVVHDGRAGSLFYFNVVAPKFFATLHTPILRGREFADSDGLTWRRARP